MALNDETTERLADPVNPPIESPELESRMGAPTDGSPGRMVVAPGLSTLDENGAGNGTSRRDRLASRQMLTGRAAKANLSLSPLTPSQLAWRKIKKNKLALAGGVLLIALYLMALFAQFLAPYDFTTQDPAASYRPPMSVHWTPSPVVYPVTQGFDEFRDRTFVEDKSQPHRLRFFANGPAYKFWGLIPTRRHLFGTTDGQRVYLLGTDQYGRDYLSRLLYASQVSLSIGLIAVAVTFTLGLVVGGISGFYGGRLDDVIMRVCEVVMSVPDFYLLLALAASLPLNIPPVTVFLLIILILSLVGWAGMARVVRGMVLSVREREYVEAARALGVSDGKIILRHVVPSTFTFAIVSASLTVPAYILAEAGLSFLGLGMREPYPSWGNMLSAAQDLNVLEHQTWLLVPGLMIFLTTISFNFLGDGLRDALDPKSR